MHSATARKAERHFNIGRFLPVIISSGAIRCVAPTHAGVRCVLVTDARWDAATAR